MKKFQNIVACFAVSVITVIIAGCGGCQQGGPGPDGPAPAPPVPPANPITAACTQTGAEPCTGSANVNFTASHAGGKAITIDQIAVVATGPNSDCARWWTPGDSENRPDVIAQAIRVNCDCGPGQTITVVIRVVDNAGNVAFAWGTLTT